MRVLLIEDEEILRVSLARELSRAGHAVHSYERPASALVAFSEKTFDVVVTDIRMPGMDGFEVLAELKRLRPNMPVVFMTAYSTVRDAVRAIRLGAFDYLTKPFDVEELFDLLERIRQTPQPDESERARQHAIEGVARVEELGTADSMRAILEDLPLVASSEEIVLITGETGTGKEHLANIIHSQSPRAARPFVKVSCAALSAQLVETELFGHEKGAFTGAERRRIGRFERAQGGTLMLDDIDDVPRPIQVKLLQVLQDKAIERVGGDQPIPVDVRVLAATKADLEALVEAGRFRRDLFYRLHVLPMRLPPLRERREDIPRMFEGFFKRYATAGAPTLSSEALAALVDYSWPGNVRELENLTKRLSVLVPDGRVEPHHLPLDLRGGATEHRAVQQGSKGSYEEEIARVERDLLLEALEGAGGNKTQAAKRLGIPPSTLRDKLAKHGILD